MKKKLWLVLCMIACIFAMTACSSIESSEKANFAYDADNLKTQAEGYLTQWNDTDFSAFLNDESLDAGSYAQFTEWSQLKSDIGEFDSVTKTKFNESATSVTVVLTAKYSKDSMDFSVMFDQTGQPLNFQAAITPSFVDQLPQNISNGLAMVGIAFLALLVILGIVYLFRLLSGMFGGSSNGETANAVDNVLTSISQSEHVELADNQELVAVITAAIMASMGSSAPADGLVVRSIKRKNTNNWNKA